MRRVVLGLSLLVASHLAAPRIAWAKPTTVAVDPAAQRDGAIVVQTLAAVAFVPHRAAYGVVLDPGTLIALRGRIVAAQVARQGGAQALTRARKLYRQSHNIALAALQGAEQHFATADAGANALTAQARAEWGRALGAALIGGGTLIGSLSDGSTSLVEAVVTGTPLTPPASATGLVSTGGHIALRLIGPASHAPAGLVGQGFYYAGPANLAIGLPLSVTLAEGKARPGVAVPAKAILYLEGHRSVFVEVTPGHFTLKPISAVAPINPRGRQPRDFVGRGLHPGDRVVVQGAGILLSAAHTALREADQD